MRALLRLSLLLLFFPSAICHAQGDAKAALRTGSNKIMVGDRAQVILEASHDPAKSKVIWPQIPDSFGKLEVLEKGKIDTVRNGAEVLYRQLLSITGFDSGVFTIPPISVDIHPLLGTPYKL